MGMLQLNINNETSRLRAVILGIADSNGKTPLLSEAYDPKSKQHIIDGTYPKEVDMVKEINAVADILERYGVTVYRPTVIENYNQIFSRDIAFVIGDKFIKANILPDRDKEYDAIIGVTSKLNKDCILELPEECHVEGGDVMPYNEYIFVGTYSGEDYPDYITARTNLDAVIALQELFPDKTVKSFELRKSNDDPYNNALHLDCCFQPVGRDKAILHKNGFLVESQYQWLVNFFGKENIFEISSEEMYAMTSNIFSISEDLVISDERFTRLNAWLESQGIRVEAVKYSEIAKQEGLLRCSTLPLIRD